MPKPQVFIEEVLEELVAWSGDEWSLENPPQEVEAWIQMRSCVEHLANACKSLRDHIDSQLVLELGDGGAVRYGERVFMARPDRKFSVTNHEGLLEFLWHCGRDGYQAFNANNVKITALRALAEQKGLDPKAVLDTMGQYEDGKAKISVLPLDKAPKWAQALNDQEVKHGRNNRDN